MDESSDLFDFVLRKSVEYWRDSSEKPPDFLWRRGDVVPVGAFAWHDPHWTCLRRDGRLVMCIEGEEDQPWPQRAHNPVIGHLIRQVHAASAYLRPPAVVKLCLLCKGSGRWRGEICICGGLGWNDAS